MAEAYGAGEPAGPADRVVVCIDDDPAVLEALKAQLDGRAAGCRVVTATSGEQGIDLVTTLVEAGVQVPVVICSFGLPGLSGTAVLGRVHALSPGTHSILLTGRFDHAAIVAAINEANLYRYIGKPWEPEDLRMTVAAAVESHARNRRQEAQITALRENEARLRAFVERAGDGILTIDEAGIVQYANPAVARLFGYPLAKIVGSELAMLMQPEDAALHDAFLRRYIDSGDIRVLGTSREVMGRHRDGHDVPVDLFINEFRVDGRRFFSGILRDIGPRRRLEQMRAEKDLAEERARAKSAFLATMSHEIRTPMNGVLGMLELLEATDLDGEQRGLLSVCRDSARFLLTIIDDILDFSKIEAGKLVMEDADLGIDDLVFSVADLLVSRAWAKEIDLVTYVDNAVPRVVRGDAARLRQILLNLVGNAIKFTAEGQVAVSVSLAGGDVVPDGIARLRFEVTDSGIGLTEEQQARLFRPFEQADAGTTRRFGGTGLGLAICRRLVDLMHGVIGVHSRAGAGATFWFEVPLPVVQDDPERPDLSGACILVAARNEKTRHAFDRGLTGAGASVLTAPSWDEARAVVATRKESGATPVDLLVVDDSAAAAIGAFSDFGLLSPDQAGGVPVLLMARRDRGAISGVQRRTGATWGLTKPARPFLLLQTTAVALGRAAPETIDAVMARVGADRAAAAGEGGAAELPFSGGRILVAEDTPTSRLVVTKMLQRLGLDPVVTEDGAEALKVLRNEGESIDLILTDCHMPDVDGFDLTRAVRAMEADGTLPHLPVVALSAGVLKEEMERCYASGMDDFLAKPVETAKLRQVLYRWLPPASRPREATLGAAGPAEGPAPPPAPARPEAPSDAPATLSLDIYMELFGALTDETRPEIAALLGAFLASADELMGTMAACESARDAAGMKAAAHRLVGTALSAGALELGAVSRRLEGAAAVDAEEVADWAALGSLRQDVGAALERVRTAIAAV